jgi:hypothetical protein
MSLLLTRHGWGHGAAQGGDSCHGYLLVAVLLGARVSWGDHVGLQQGALQVYMVVRQSLIHCSQNLGARRGREKEKVKEGKTGDRERETRRQREKEREKETKRGNRRNRDETDRNS